MKYGHCHLKCFPKHSMTWKIAPGLVLNENASQAWLYISVIPALGTWRQEDGALQIILPTYQVQG
jgi:hypothetical protein